MSIIDFHAHAFPDELAERAIPALQAEAPDVKAALDGKVSSLLRSMDEVGIEKVVVASIATKPKQFSSIVRWSKEIASDRIIPFPSFHPADPEVLDRVRILKEEGFKGLKLHPYYQGFDLDGERMWPIYEAIQASGLIWLCHTGFDIAFPRIRKCDPVRIRKVIEAFPELKLVTSHLGAWQDWEEVRLHLLGKPVYMELSFSIDQMPRALVMELMLTHPQEYLLFGTDSPWTDQKHTLGLFRSLHLDAEREAAILGGNASRLLGLD
jgi:hypothetical protein